MSSEEDIRAWRGRVEGRVQGVSFRAAMQRKARECGVVGWVRNRPDGTVEFFAQGDADAVRQLLDWTRRGPPGAGVDAFHQTDTEPVTGLVGFEVRY